MPTQSAPNLSTWRTGHPYRAFGYLYVLRPTIVFQALVNMASVSYPLTSITFDTVTTGAYTDVRPNMTVFIGSSAGAYDQGRQRIRSAASSSVLTIGRSSRGTRPGEVNVTDNAYITVIDLKEVWAKIPYITPDGISFKD